MPKNSDVHSARILKVRQGFTAARINPSQVTQILAMFDGLSASNAVEVSQRTEFSVSSMSKAAAFFGSGGDGEERRQMARALLFVNDIKKLHDDRPLQKKLTDAEFEGLWRGESARLASMLAAKVKALCEPAIKIPEITVRPVVAGPPPGPRPIVITDDLLNLLNPIVARQQRLAKQAMSIKPIAIPDATRTLLTATLENQQRRQTELKTGQSSLQTLKFAWGSAKSGLTAVFAALVNSSTSNTTAVQIAASSAYTEFEGFFREVGKEKEAKLAMAKSFFDALASYAPFPLSIVGKVGAAACSVLHVDTEIPKEAQLGPQKYFDSNIPTLVKFNSKLNDLKRQTNDLTRLGVDGGAMPSGVSIQNATDIARGKAVTLLNKVFLDAINETYGGTLSEEANKSTDFYTAVQNSLGGERGGARPELVSQMAINKVTALFNTTKASIESAGTLVVVRATDIQPFIELQLLAEYLAALIPDQDFTRTIPDALINRLTVPPLEIVVRKTGSGQTDLIYGMKKLPWDSGHPRHVGAMVYFFRWYKKSVNPFDIATGRVTVKGVRDAMETAITEIGKSIQQHKVSNIFSADSADWALVGPQVAKIGGV